jgi:hypothetical protein
MTSFVDAFAENLLIEVVIARMVFGTRPHNKCVFVYLKVVYGAMHGALHGAFADLLAVSSKGRNVVA